MKFCFTNLFIFGVCWTSFGQSTQPYFAVPDTSVAFTKNNLTIGLDIFKNLPYFLLKNPMPVPTSQSARLRNQGIVELALRKEASRGGYWVGLLGYAQAEITDPENIVRRQQIRGWYAKGGKELILGRNKGHSKLGVRGILTYVRTTNDLLYSGPTFGDYEFTDRVGNMGIGFEPYYAYDVFLGPRWLLRWETRWSHHIRLIGKGDTPYYPGAGVSFGFYNYVVSGGTTFQLHYRFQR